MAEQNNKAGMNKLRLYDYLNSISPLSQEAFESFYALIEFHKFAKGEYFAQDGRIEKSFGILETGTVRTFFRTQSGEEFIKSFATPYAFIGGFSALITGCKNSINVQTLSDCHVLIINYSEFCKLYSRFVDINTLSRRLTELLFVAKENREQALISLTAEKRYLKFKENTPNLENTIPQYHVASFLGISPTQLSRIRKNLKG